MSVKLRLPNGSDVIFGSFDGLTSVIGVVIALGGVGLVRAVGGLACASAVGMGAGQWLSDATPSLREAVVMALATCAGTVLPVFPLLLTYSPVTVALSAFLAVLLTAFVAEQRPERRRLAYARTFAVLALVVAVTVPIALLTDTT